MIKTLIKDKQIMHNALIIILILACVRLFYLLPVPGINPIFFQDIIKANGTLGFVNMLTGNGLSNISIMMLNITPFITASIIMQLMGNIIPRLHEMQRGLKDEQKKYENVSFVLSVILAMAESAAIAVGYGKHGLFLDFTWYWCVIAVVIWTLGSAACALVGKQINEKYKVNGTSLILLLNILSGYPAGIRELHDKFIEPVGGNIINNVIGTLTFSIIVLILIAAMFIFVNFIHKSEEDIVVQYSGKSGTSGKSSKDTIPLKLCPGSVVPIIFASSLMSTPALIGEAITAGEETPFWIKLMSSNYWFRPEDWLPTIGVVIFILLIFGFSFYYADFNMNARELSDNLRKNGAVIEGIRPGSSTTAFLKRHINGMVFIGSFALILIAVIPIVISGLFDMSHLAFFGTSVIITVGVIAELIEHLRANARYSQYSVNGGIFS